VTNYRGSRSLVVDKFDGLVTLVERMDLPVGKSPACQNVEFYPGGVRSRYGFSTALNPSNTGRWNGLWNYILRDTTRKLVGLQSNGELRQASGTIDTQIGADMYLQASQLYGRTYLAISAGAVRIPPLWWDGTTLARHTVGPPGGRPVGSNSATAGNIAAGARKVAVCFVHSDGTVSAPTWDDIGFTAAGSKKMNINLPLGISTVVARMFFVTVTGLTTWSAADAFHLPDRMLIQDNTTITVSDVDFTEAQLIAGTPLSDFMEHEPLAGYLGSCAYHNRLVTWGAPPSTKYRDNIGSYLGTSLGSDLYSALNLEFEGGPSAADATLPNSWVDAGAPRTGGALAVEAGAPWKVWKITGDGVTATRGEIYNGSSGFSYLWAMFRQNTRYGIRFRLKKSAGATGGAFTVRLESVPGTFATLTKSVSLNSFSTGAWVTFDDANFGTVGAFDATSANNIRIYIGTTGAMPNGEWVAIYGLQFYESPTSATAGGTEALLRISRAFDPGRFSNIDGFVTVNKDDGQDINCCFVLRNNLYVVKERSLWVTTDTGTAEPAGWPVSQVSDTVGTYSVTGVGIGDGWVVIAARSGLYYFDGGAPTKLSQEIQPTWDGINWQYGSTIWVVVDSEAKRIMIGVPTSDSVRPDTTLVLDYTNGMGQGRQWTTWTQTGNSANLIEQSDGSRKLYVGTNDSTGLVLQYDTTTRGDNGSAINAFYETAPLGEPHGLALITGMELQCSGVGTLTISHRPPDGVVRVLRQYGQLDPWHWQIEFPLHLVVERTGFRLATNSSTHYFNLQRLAVWEKPHPLGSRGRTP
jgi:hypothetical protein